MSRGPARRASAAGILPDPLQSRTSFDLVTCLPTDAAAFPRVTLYKSVFIQAWSVSWRPQGVDGLHY